MILAQHGINSLKRANEEYVSIGGRNYPVVRIGNQLWTTENLDWKAQGITVTPPASGLPSTPCAWYYNNSESIYGENGKKYGLLYNWYCVPLLNSLLPTGWRIPTESDYRILGESVGGLQNAATHLKATTGWQPISDFPHPNGIDDYGFHGIPSGIRGPNGFAYAGEYAFYLTSTEQSDTNYFIRISLSPNTDMDLYGIPKDRALAIRLVKDSL